MKWGLFSLLVIALVIFGCETNNYTNEVVNMNISSPAFNDLAMIPKNYTCQGQNINPPLEFHDIPEGTVSLVLIMDDPDAPLGTWDHWIVFNIPPNITKISEDSVPEDSVQGMNSWLKNNYGGPCPPQGTHRYFFKLYALDRMLELDDTVNKKDVETAMSGHIIEKTQMIGLYRKE